MKRCVNIPTYCGGVEKELAERLQKENPDLYTYPGQVVHKARNKIIWNMKQHDYDGFFMIDDDLVPELSFEELLQSCPQNAITLFPAKIGLEEYNVFTIKDGVSKRMELWENPDDVVCGSVAFCYIPMPVIRHFDNHTNREESHRYFNFWAMRIRKSDCVPVDFPEVKKYTDDEIATINVNEGIYFTLLARAMGIPLNLVFTDIKNLW